MPEHIIIYSLFGCPFSEAAVKLLEDNEIEHKVIKINQEEKNDCKIKNNMSTFPQIFYVDNNGNTEKIGGYDNLNNILELKINIKKNINQFDKLINNGIVNINKKLLIRVLLLSF